jgi:hypothetical protein
VLKILPLPPVNLKIMGGLGWGSQVVECLPSNTGPEFKPLFWTVLLYQAPQTRPSRMESFMCQMPHYRIEPLRKQLDAKQASAS